MIVVADTRPLNYLIQMGNVDILRRMYKTVLLPAAVAKELSALGAPESVRRWISARPTWITIVDTGEITDAGLLRLGWGERQAMILALEQGADILVVDDMPARRIAMSLGLRVTGTLGVLRDAANNGLVNFSDCVVMLRNSGFRMTQTLVDALLQEID